MVPETGESEELLTDTSSPGQNLTPVEFDPFGGGRHPPELRGRDATQLLDGPDCFGIVW